MNYDRRLFEGTLSRVFSVTFASLLGVACYGGHDRPPPEPIAEDAEVVLPSPERLAAASGDVASIRQAWQEITHVNLSTLAATKWGLSASRVQVIGDAADDPDTYESGIDNGFNQQWSHAYIYTPFGFWIWGDANENFDDCITGNLAGQIEGPECKDGQSAHMHYDAHDQLMGDRFLGYATHYVEDVCQVLHSSMPTNTDMLTHHFDYEAWVANNWVGGYNLSAAVSADNYYYPITDLQQTVRNAAWASSYWNSQSAGRTVWNAYRAAGFPTAAGTGGADLANATTQLLIRASRYATGAIKYTLDRYGQWSSTY